MSNDTKNHPMTAETIHTCSYYCERPECVKAQRDELRDRMLSTPHPAIVHCDRCGCDWLDNGLNPVGCPYCKQSEQAAEIEALREEVERLRADLAESLEEARNALYEGHPIRVNTQEAIAALRERLGEKVIKEQS